MNIGHVVGGTNAGWRTVKPPRKPFDCCGKTHAAHWTRCPDCGAPPTN